MKTAPRLSRTPEAIWLCVALIFLLCSVSSSAQKKAAAGKNPSAAVPAEADFSGMYSFLREGEFVQITVEKESDAKDKRTAKVTGFISRFGDDESDKGEFLDHFFTRGSLTGNKLTFATRQIHGVSFEFNGTIERGVAKSRAEDGYYVLSGTLTRNTLKSANKSASQSREITMKLFPDMDDDPKSTKQ